MMELNKVTRVEFFEDEHRYILDGTTELKGVTTIMRENGLSPDYGGIDEEVLRHAAEMGTMAHKAIEDYCNGIAVQETSLIKSFKKLGIDAVCCEYLVTDYDSIASSIDMVAKVDDNTVDLIDMKRTSSVHTDALAWQLGIYKVLFESINPHIKVRNCYCLHIKKGLKNSIDKDVCEPLIPVTPVSADKVEELISCVQVGMPFVQESATEVMIPFSDSELLQLGVVEGTIARLESELKQAKEMADAFHERLYNHMLSTGLESICIGEGTYTLKRPYARQGLDAKKLKAEMPEIAERYKTVSEVKGNVTFKHN